MLIPPETPSICVCVYIYIYIKKYIYLYICLYIYPEGADVIIQMSSPCLMYPWYISDGQIHEDLVVTLFADTSEA